MSRIKPYRRALNVACLALLLLVAPSARAAGQLQATPLRIVLVSPEAAEQLLVSQESSNGGRTDLTRTVSYDILHPDIARVDERGLVRAVAEGQTEISITYQNQQLVIPVEARGIDDPVPVSFQYEVSPILTKSGCNSSGCHGKAEGQNGFRLSVFGFDAAADHAALAKEARGRRVNPAAPDRSLLLLKGTGRMPHGGGQKIDPHGYRHQRLHRWIAEGAQFAVDPEPSSRVVGIGVEPKQQVLLADQSQQLRVTAVDAAGNRRCVTAVAEYESNIEPIAEVDSRGLVRTGDIAGEGVILVR